MLARLIIFITLSVPLKALAHADDFLIRVLSFDRVGELQHKLVFEAEDTRYYAKTVPKEKRKYIVHITYEPKLAGARGLTKQRHIDALDLLNKQISIGENVNIMRISSKGFNPIKGKKGEFRTFLLKVFKSGSEEETVVFLHSDRWIYSPK